MVANVMPINQDSPIPQAAARLCNIPTGLTVLLPEHKQWLDHVVGPILWRLDGIWVDLIGYASKLGSSESNMVLSANRVAEVRKYINQLKAGTNFQQATALGEEESTGDENNNDGYFRAVEVYVYGFNPGPLAPRAEAKKGESLRKRFYIRLVSAISAGGGIGVDLVAFDIGEPKKPKWRRFMYAGVSMNFSVKLPEGVTLPPLGTGGTSGSVPFYTSRPVEIEDFEGWATLFNGPGAALGPLSIGGEVGLNPESENLIHKGAVVSPRPITMSTGGGFGVSLGGAGKGKLKLYM
jgi:hypothetical protein